ncbi:MAG: Unknown protein [uncultured Sulfurovum sp.]|uniref:Uncharacterized protein n=1 Tax=uncultured Sulfurovum sp. TaxID=269237 RepID=A0A6S6SG14_9BACT|nr:MAG: Unknown protein [uncultured Sulfurovum sp.]
MFSKKNDYRNAIRYIENSASGEIKLRNKILFIFNFIFLGFLTYVMFNYLQSNTNTFSFPVFKEAVLGVSETVDEVALENVKMIKVLMPRPSIQSQPFYTEAMATSEY